MMAPLYFGTRFVDMIGKEFKVKGFATFCSFVNVNEPFKRKNAILYGRLCSVMDSMFAAHVPLCLPPAD